MTVLLILLGLIPGIFGWIQNWLLFAMVKGNPPMWLIQWLFLLIWGYLAYTMEKQTRKTKQVLLYMNLLPLVMLVLLAVQEFAYDRMWVSFIGATSQFYFLPLLSLGFRLTHSVFHTTFPAYVACFLLMILASGVGCACSVARRSAIRDKAYGTDRYRQVLWQHFRDAFFKKIFLPVLIAAALIFAALYVILPATM